MEEKISLLESQLQEAIKLAESNANLNATMAGSNEEEGVDKNDSIRSAMGEELAILQVTPIEKCSDCIRFF